MRATEIDEPDALGDLLRRHRVAAGLTQEALAEQAGLSARGIADLERGVRRFPHANTLNRLANAMQLTDDERSLLKAQARRVVADRRHPTVLTKLLAPQRHNLPPPRTRLIGRAHDSTTVRDLVLQAPGRLVTLTGTGGCGKTQLALMVAAELVDTFADGVWLVELASVQAPHLVPYALAAVLGRHQRAGEALIDALVADLRAREVLLVLDNCEHLIDACADLADRLLMGCSKLRLLATSRERLRSGAEKTWRVPSLPGPDPRATLAPADLLAYPAVQLFVERAQAVQPDFALSPTAASSMAGICARLEGLPLALELAAARVTALSLAQILERLDDSFRLLVGGNRTAPTRQQTLRATLDWSHGLLSAAEQTVFRRLAVFSGGWSLEAAEAVCPVPSVRVDADPAVLRFDVLEPLSHLVDKSLVVVSVDEGDGRSRYRLLEPIRQYAREHLLTSGELDAIGRRHAAFFLDFAEALERDANVGGGRRNAAADALQSEYRNLQVALRSALARQDAELGLRLACALQFIWKFRLPLGEGRPWLEELLALPGADAPTPARAVALLAAAYLAWGRGDYSAADRYYAEADPLARRLGDAWILFVAQCDQGIASLQRGDNEAARAFWREGLVTTRASGDTASEAILLLCLGRLDIYEGNYALGRALCEECLEQARQIGDTWVIWGALHALALAALAQGDLATAQALSYESLNLTAQPVARADVLLVLGQVAIGAGGYAEARRHLCEALELVANSGDGLAIAHVVEEVAHFASCVGQSGVAMRLAAAADAARARLSAVIARSIETFPHYPISRDLRERWLVPLRKTLTVEDACRSWAEGRVLSLDEAVALAESSLPAAALIPSPRVDRSLTGPLTPRQLEVAVLIAQGLTNRQIAERLVVTERAAAAHVEHILDKLAVGSRAQIAVWVAERGLLATPDG